MRPNLRQRDITMVLIGVLGLLLKSWFSAPLPELVYNHLGNFSVSYAIYFLALLAAQGRWGRLPAAAMALAVVEAFELTNGFGVMANVYDPWDLLANALGIALALGMDALSARWFVAAARPETG